MRNVILGFSPQNSPEVGLKALRRFKQKIFQDKKRQGCGRDPGGNEFFSMLRPDPAISTSWKERTPGTNRLRASLLIKGRLKSRPKVPMKNSPFLSIKHNTVRIVCGSDFLNSQRAGANRNLRHTSSRVTAYICGTRNSGRQCIFPSI